MIQNIIDQFREAILRQQKLIGISLTRKSDSWVKVRLRLLRRGEWRRGFGTEEGIPIHSLVEIHIRLPLALCAAVEISVVFFPI